MVSYSHERTAEPNWCHAMAGEKMEIHMNISFPRLPCELLTLDVMDVSGKEAMYQSNRRALKLNCTKAKYKQE